MQQVPDWQKLTNNTAPSATGNFPNASLLTPLIALKAGSGDTTGGHIYVDWWACAQASPSATVTGPDTAPP